MAICETKEAMIMAKELDKISNEKIETRSDGAKIMRGFSFAGSSGVEMNLWEELAKQGFEDLYFVADYAWGMINIKKMQIFTYTEGDTFLITLPSLRSLYNEVVEYQKFENEQHNNNRAITGEIPGILKKIEKVM